MPILSDVKADAFREYGDSSIKTVLTGFFTKRTFRVLVLVRFCQGVAAMRPPVRALLPVFKVLHRLSCQLAGMDFPWSVSLGAGVCINHGWGLVISPGAKIGHNVTLFHGVTLDRRDRISRDGTRHVGYPTIEDGVWIGPNAVIVGAIRIGKGSRIAAGAFVTEDIPERCVVIGNPCQIAKFDAEPDIKNEINSKMFPSLFNLKTIDAT